MAGSDGGLAANVEHVERAATKLASYAPGSSADGSEDIAASVRRQLENFEVIEGAAERLAVSVEGQGQRLELTLRAVVLAMRQRQASHGRLVAGPDPELAQDCALVTACADRVLKRLVAAPWTEEAGGEADAAVASLVVTLVELIGVGCEPQLWAPLQNTAVGKLVALREAGRLALHPRGAELRQIIGTELVKRLRERQETLREHAGHPQPNPGADGVEKQAKVLRFFAVKGAGLIPSEPIGLVEGLLGVAADTVFVAWHQPAGSAASSLSLAEVAVRDMLAKFGQELSADDHGEGVLAALAAWFGSSADGSPPLGVLLCLARLLPLVPGWPVAQRASAVPQLVQLARSAVHRLCTLTRHKEADHFGALFAEVTASLAQWAVALPASHQPQLQLLLLELLLVPRGEPEHHPQSVAASAAVALAVWDVALRAMEDGRTLHAHAQTLLNIVAGTKGQLPPSLVVACRGLLATVCTRLGAATSAEGEEEGDSGATLQELMGSLAATVASRGTLGLVLPPALQPSSADALRALQDATAEAQRQQQPAALADLGRALASAAAATSSDAAPLAGGDPQLAVVLQALYLLAAGGTMLTPSAVAGAASMLCVATRLEAQSGLDRAAVKKLRDAACSVLRTALGPPLSQQQQAVMGAEAGTLLLPRVLALTALVESVSAIGSAAEASDHSALKVLRHALTFSAVVDGDAAVTAGREWRAQHVLNAAAQALLKDCRLQQLERVLPTAVAQYAFSYAVAESAVAVSENGAQRLEAHLASEKGMAEDPQHAGADCWERPCKRTRTAAAAAAASSAEGVGGGSLRALMESSAVSLEQVGQLLAAVDAEGLGELQRQLQELQQC